MLSTRDDVLILDVRPQNFKRSPYFIKGAYHCPLLNLVERLGDFPKDKEIVIVDWKMMQSPLAAKFLQREGFKIGGVIRGGIERWIAEGLPTEVRKSEQ